MCLVYQRMHFQYSVWTCLRWEQCSHTTQHDGAQHDGLRMMEHRLNFRAQRNCPTYTLFPLSCGQTSLMICSLVLICCQMLRQAYTIVSSWNKFFLVYCSHSSNHRDKQVVYACSSPRSIFDLSLKFPKFHICHTTAVNSGIIEHHRPVSCSSRSPDLNSLDLFLWGTWK